jgi:hypothetical protein
MDAIREGFADTLISEREGHVDQGLEHDSSESEPVKDSTPAACLKRSEELTTPLA